MISGLRLLSMLALIAPACAPTAALGAAPKNTLRVLKSEVPFEATDEVPTVVDESPVRLVVEPIEQVGAEEPLPPVVGGELAEPGPNPYHDTTPSDAQSAYPWPEQPGAQYGHPAHAAAHTSLGHYIHSRPRQPQLERESWLNRPYNASFFLGGLFLDNPIAGQTDGEPGFMYGIRLGWDFGPHFGVETRLAGAEPGLRDPSGLADLPPANVFLWDMNWLFYWTGDTRWRPYFSFGMGMFDISYQTATTPFHQTTLEMPFGVGLKYRHSTRVAVRFDLLDNFTFATGQQEGMHNLSFTAGLEARFGGGMRRNYWPWNPGHDWR